MKASTKDVDPIPLGTRSIREAREGFIISQGKTLDEPYGSLTRANPKGGRDSLRERSLTSSLQNLSHSSNGISQTWSLLELARLREWSQGELRPPCIYFYSNLFILNFPSNVFLHQSHFNFMLLFILLRHLTFLAPDED